MDEGGSHIILRAEWVAGADSCLGAAVLKREQQVGSLCGYMQTGCDTQARQRLLLGEALLYLSQHGHLARCPVDAADAFGCK